MDEHRRGVPISYPPRRWVRRVAVAVVLLVGSVALSGGRLYSYPHTDSLDGRAPVDAVLALGGRTETAGYAIELAERGLTPVVVISDPYPQEAAFQGVHDLCDSRPTGYQVICFDPDPRTTRGEARELGRLAEENGWDRVAVVAARYHVSRARTIVRRCYPGTLLMVQAPMDIPWANWTYQYVRQTLGYLKVALQEGC